MSAGPPPPLFVERQTYRLRRLRDAARALPVLALMLWLVPILWSMPGEAVSASGALIYLFGTWAALGLSAGLLIWAIERAERRARAAEDEARARRETAP
ncbi:hypothetical protein [Citreimonas sp.]|uniref:hypothetical protein n=1 Tax=Citreimonas sp. TaxID=3036715 RepID=UPI0035C853F8